MPLLLIDTVGLLSALGMYAASVYGRKTRRFLWRGYIALIAAPIACSVGLSVLYGPKILYLFIASSFAGMLFEYWVGKAYHRTLNKRLWVYKRYDLNGYTSWLALPMWGVAGIVFWMLGKVIGL